MYKDKSKWNTLGESPKSKAIAKLLDVSEAKILRIGNDTSDESEISHMDGVLLKSRILVTSASTNEEDSEFILAVNGDGQKLLREMNGDIVAYYIINAAEIPEMEDIQEKRTSSIWGFAHSSDFKHFHESIKQHFKILDEKDANHMEWIYRRLLQHGEAENVDYMIKFREIFGIKELLTKEELEIMKPGTIIAKGVIENSEDGLFMSSSDIGKKLLWIAKRGQASDWAIYAHWEENGFDYVLTQGDKVSKYNVNKLVPCTEEALKMYRS